MTTPPGDLAANIHRFCSELRSEHGFRIGTAEIHDAVKAAHAVGVADPRRFRTALRLVCCASPAEIETFDTAWDDFFIKAHRTRQPRPSQQRTLESRAPGATGHEVPQPKRPRGDSDDDSLEDAARKRERRPAETQSAAQAWMTMLARYSPLAAAAPSPIVSPEDADALMLAAGRLIASVRSGRSREWRPHARGPRLDVRRTLRSSLRTAGDPLTLRRLGHPARNPRFVLFIDGSRSMTGHRSLLVAFAYAMVQRSRRAGVWLFSTGLRNITRDLRNVHRDGARELRELGDAWGGGTRIGGALLEFVRTQGGRIIDEDTTVLIFSDGLDVGEIDEMRRALRDMRSRGADIIWINPHAGLPGFAPSARAMKAALPLVDALVGVQSAHDFRELPERIRRARRSKVAA
jgi:uncharacterized protein with von Willebrand factor type A (vWA) domain